MLEYLFESLHLHRAAIQCGVANLRSCAIPKRLGFTRQGVLRQTQVIGDRSVDLAMCRMLEDEWRQRGQLVK